MQLHIIIIIVELVSILLNKDYVVLCNMSVRDRCNKYMLNKLFPISVTLIICYVLRNLDIHHHLFYKFMKITAKCDRFFKNTILQNVCLTFRYESMSVYNYISSVLTTNDFKFYGRNFNVS